MLTDTDSLMYEIKTEDVYLNFSSNKEMFDFSNDSTKSKYYDDSNKLVVGKMENETCSFFILPTTNLFELKNLFDWSQRCICFWYMKIASIKKQRARIKMLF